MGSVFHVEERAWQASIGHAQGMVVKQRAWERERRVEMSWETRFVGSRYFLDFKFQIKETGFILHSLESPTNCMFQKDTFDCGVDEEGKGQKII